jgi:hypothetical protein
MIDFSSLERPSPEKQERDVKARRDREIEADHARRTERAKKSLILTCTEDARQYFAFSGTKYLSIHGTDTNGQAVSASWYAPDHATDEELASVRDLLVEGSTVQLQGYWKPFQNHRNETKFSFMAQFVHPVIQDLKPRPLASPEDQLKAFD